MKAIFTLTVLALIFSITSAYAQWTSTNLSEAKAQMGSAAHGSKVYFSGGYASTGFSDVVEIYSPSTNSWETNSLSQARSFSTAVPVGNKVLFAGGIDYVSLEEYDVVDIFDTLTQTWEVANLSKPGFYVQAVSYQNTALFAGFYDVVTFSPLNMSFSNVVNIYNATTGTWSVDTLSQARGNMSATVVGDLALFAGGQTSTTTMSKRVDIYHFTTGTWSTASLSIARGFSAAVTVGNKAIFAGGTTSLNMQSNAVDIFDYETGEWSTATLSAPRSFTTKGAAACGKAFFAGGGKLNLPTFSFNAGSNVIDIYDAESGTWSTDTLSRFIVNHSVVATQNQILIAGGVQFLPTGASASDLVEIYTCESTGVSQEPDLSSADITLFPNPAGNFLQLVSEGYELGAFRVEIFDMNGRLVKNGFLQNSADGIPIDNLNNGGYILKAMNEDQIVVKKLIKSVSH